MIKEFAVFPPVRRNALIYNQRQVSRLTTPWKNSTRFLPTCAVETGYGVLTVAGAVEQILSSL